MRPPSVWGVEALTSSLTTRALADTARVEARGAAPVGSPTGADLAAGERVELPLGPGCYTILAHGGLGVLETDALVIDGDSASAVVVGSDVKSGPVSVVGGAQGCVEVRGAGARAVVLVRTGVGHVVVGIYRRP